MNALPTCLADIESLVRNQVPESVHLDYKASPALDPKKRDEIAKDVSAFANSDGGLLVYGVEEDKASHLPRQIDDGVDPKWNREWVDQIINSSITPRIDGAEVADFPLPNGRCVVCIRVPKSFRGPHQAPGHRYYKRFNLSSVPMEHYEIEDLRARAQTVPPLIVLDMKVPSENLLPFVVRNVGNVAARDIRFDWGNDMKWPSGQPPSQFSRGISFLPPGKVLVIFCHGPNKIFNWKETGHVFQFDIEVSYQAGASADRIRDVFHFDIADYRSTALFATEAESMDNHAAEICRTLGDLVRAVQAVSRSR